MMRQLTKWESIVLLVGGVLMVVGSGACVLMQSWAASVFAVGVLLFTAILLRQGYEGTSMVVRRLRRIQLLSCLLMWVAALLMIASQSNFLGLDYLFYVKYVHNNWVVVLLVAAILQLYSSHRIANEMEKEAKKR